jgi:gentisate 1,2-dioxygenase
LKDLVFDKPTILFSQKGNWKVKIEENEFNINSKDTFSLPLNTKVSVSIDNNEDCFLNCVSKA